VSAHRLGEPGVVGAAASAAPLDPSPFAPSARPAEARPHVLAAGEARGAA